MRLTTVSLLDVENRDYLLASNYRLPAQINTAPMQACASQYNTYLIKNMIQNLKYIRNFASLSLMVGIYYQLP